MTEVYTPWRNCKITWPTFIQSQKFILLEVTARWRDPSYPKTEVYTAWGYCKMTSPTFTQWQKFILLAVTARWPDPILPKDWSLYCLRWLQDDVIHFYQKTEVNTAWGNCKMTWPTFTQWQTFILLEVTPRWPYPLLPNDRSLYCSR